MSSLPFHPEESPIEGTMLLEASAGTGKTYALERIVARLIGRDADPLSIDEILVVTFTNRAAREMKQRILALLTRRAAEADRDEAERRRYRLALSKFDSAAIFTIHGFCRMVLAAWPFECSAPFRQELVPGGELELAEARAWLAGGGDSSPDRRMFRAAYHRAGSAEALAGRLASVLMDEGIPPGARVLPTRDEASAFLSLAESSARPGSPLSEAAEAVFGPSWTDNQFLALFKAAGRPKKTRPSLEKIRSHMNACREVAGLLPLAEKMFSDPAGCGVRDHFKELLAAADCANGGLGKGMPEGANGGVGKGMPEGANGGPEAGMPDGADGGLGVALRGLLSLLEPHIEIRASSGNPKAESLVQRRQNCAFEDEACRAIGERLEKRKDEEGRWGYADLVRRVADAVGRPDSPLRPLLRGRYRAALIDEFQDTDPRQWELFRAVFDTPDHMLILIGDPKQSIYGFRGTGLEAYGAARSGIPESRRYHLDTNYRSREPLVRAVNTIFGAVFRHRPAGAPDLAFHPVKSGSREAVRLKWPQAEVPITIFDCESESDAAARIVSEIREMLDPDTGALWVREDGSEEIQVAASDIAVLVRKARQESDILNRLIAAGVPALVYRSRSVLTQPTAISLLAVLSALQAPRNLPRWRSVLLGDFFRLPPDLLLAFETEGRLDLLVETGVEWREAFLAGRAAETLESFLGFSTVLADWADSAGRPDAAAFLRRPWDERVLREPEGHRHWQDWRHLAELIQGRQSEGLCDPAGILDWMREAAASGDAQERDDALRLESEAPAVRVMTMHAAKGLEFPLVFLQGDYSGKTKRNSSRPHYLDGDGGLIVDRLCREESFDGHRERAWEEDKRLWYVAFTRAAFKVWLPRPNTGNRVAQAESLLDLAAGSKDQQELPPHETLSGISAEAFREGLSTRLRALAAADPPLFSLEAGGPDPLPPPPLPPPSGMPEPVLGKIPADPPGRRDPVTGSYTSLSRQLAEGRAAAGKLAEARLAAFEEAPEAADRDNDAFSGGEGGALPNIPLPEDRGREFGTLVHGLLEACDFALAREADRNLWLADEAMEDLFSSLSGRFYPPAWYRGRRDDLKDLVRVALRAPIPGLGRLCDVEPAARRAEVEFQMAVRANSPLPAGEGGIALERGFLRGFIDLLVQIGGLWWVVDWKTNVPQRTEQPWSAEALAEVMDAHHYSLQYELYLLALCRTLSGGLGRPVRWDTEIGGAAYLFLRGLNEDDATGIRTAKPELERMRELAKAMGAEGVLA